MGKHKRKKGFRLKDALDQKRDVGDWLRRQIFDRDKWICQLCGHAVTPETATIDHIEPISEGGSLNDPKNLRTAHAGCNRSRGVGPFMPPGPRGQMETLVFGWSWQVWTEDVYPGPHWEFWMKCCPRCYKGPLTGVPDSDYEHCEICVPLVHYAERFPLKLKRTDYTEADRLIAREAIKSLHEKNEALFSRNAASVEKGKRR